MFKKKIIFILFFLFSSFFTSPVFGQKEKIANNINPVRGLDFWQLSDTPNYYVNFQKNIGIKNNFPITWLIRPDYFLNYPDNLFLDPKFKNDELGLFLEITPSWANLANIKYNYSLPWYHSQNIFLSGYNPKDRFKLIDVAMDQFKKIYGFYPKSVGAWHIDANSANYLVSKYQVNTFLICADQTSTDGYQIWGSWWGVPFYPSKNNLLIPAQSKSDKLNALVLFWALRDPVNAYGSGKSSLYSLQANDYLKENLDIKYFHQLSNIYLNQTTNDFGQVTVGLENDNQVQYQNEYDQQINDLLNSGVKFTTTSDFYYWYSQKYPQLTPDVEISGSDPLNSNLQFKWILQKNGRVRLIKKETSNTWVVDDLRKYDKYQNDPYTWYKNIDNFLIWKINPQIDSVFNIGQTISFSNDLLKKSSNFNYQIFIQIFVIIGVSLTMFSLIKKIKLIPFLVIILGTVVWSITMFRSGSLYQYGIGFWGPNGHDAIWHLSLINQLQKNIPPQNPVFSNTILTSYHWGFDFFTAILGKVLYLDNTFLYFKILPIIFALTIGTLAYILIKKNTKDKKTAIFFTFFTFFSGSFGWIYTLIKTGQIGGESLFWSMQSVSTLINPPYALSLVVLLFGLLIWAKHKNKPHYPIAILNGLIFGVLAGIKVYSGVLIGLTMFTIWFINFLKTKKIFNYNFFVWVITLIISIIILFSLGINKSNSVMEFNPLWFNHSMIESIDKFYLPKVASYRMSLSENISLIKIPLLLAIEIGLTFIFLVGNLGFRFLGFISIVKKIIHQKVTDLDQVFLFIMFFSFIIPLLFTQKGTAWNTIQFFYYFLFAANLFFAQFISQIFSKKKYLTIFIIIVLSNLTSWATIKDYLGNPPPAAIPQKEIEALNFLREQNFGYVLTYPYDQYLKNKYQVSTPVPIYMYETTAYVSAFSHKNTFLEDEMNLDITGFDWQSRRKEVEKFFSTNDKFFARGFLVNNQIDYIYLIGEQKINLGEADLQVNLIFDNGQVKIYKVQR